MKLEKITDEERRAGRRYDDACGTAHALELVGERWALLILRELMLGPRRFGDLRRDLPGLSANVLTQRLAGLEESGLLVHRRLPPPASVSVYELTDWGYECEPIIRALGRWAARSPRHDPTLPFSPVSLILSMRTMWAPERAGDLRARLALRVRGEDFFAEIDNGVFTAGRGTAEKPDLAIEGEAAIFAAALYGGRSFAELEREGAIRMEGDRALAEHFATLFPLPPKLSLPAVSTGG